MEASDGTRNVIAGGTFSGPIVQGRDITVVTPAPVPLALRGLPADVATFVGRQAEIERLRDAFRPAATPVGVTVVSGLPGIGKTTLVVHAAHRARELGWFPGEVLFSDLNGYSGRKPSEPAQVLSQFVRALGVPAEHTPSDEAELRRLYLTRLAEHPESILVLLDNVASTAQVAPLVPGVPWHRVVVTSRGRLSDLVGSRHMEVAVLDSVTAVQMLDKALRAADPDDGRISAEPQAASELARLCGYLPLALWIAAVSLIADPEGTVRDSVALLSQEHERLSNLAYGDDLAVRAAFEISYRALTPEQARMFRLLGLFPGPEFSTEAAARLAGLDLAQAGRVLNQLRQAYLVLAGLSRGRFRQHDLLREYAAERVVLDEPEESRAEAFDRLLGYVKDQVIAADLHLSSQVAAGTPSDRFADWKEAVGWLDTERPNLVELVQAASEQGRWEFVQEMGFTLFWYLYLRRRGLEALNVHGHARTAAQRLGDPHSEVHSLVNLGLAYAELRRFTEAIDCYNEGRLLLPAVAAQGIDHGNHEAILLNDLGLAFRELGRLEEAAEYHRQGLAELPPQHDAGRLEAIMLHDHGLALAALGRSEEAADRQRAALATFHRLGDRHHEGEAHTDLGLMLQDLGRIDEGVTHQEAALAIYGELGDRYFEAIVLGRLAAALSASGDTDRALTLLDQAAGLFHEFADLRRETDTLTRLATLLDETGRPQQASAARDRAAELQNQPEP